MRFSLKFYFLYISVLVYKGKRGLLENNKEDEKCSVDEISLTQNYNFGELLFLKRGVSRKCFLDFNGVEKKNQA